MCGLWVLKFRLYAVLMVLFFLTNGFQLIPASYFDTGMGLQKGADFALIGILFIVAYTLPACIRIIKEDYVARSILYFLAFILIGILYSKFILAYDIMIILRVARRFLFFLGYFIYRQLTLEDSKKLVTYILNITTVLCFVYLSQLLTGTVLLNRQGDEMSDAMGGRILNTSGTTIRMYNLPDFTIFSLFYCIFSSSIRGWLRPFYISVFSLSFVMTMHRSWLSWFVMIIMFLIVAKNSTLWKKLVLGGLVILFSTVPILFPAIGERLNSGIGDIQNALQGGYEARGDFEDSFSFRIAHVLERWNYISKDTEKMIFGIGFLTEDASQSRYLNFTVGWRDSTGLRQIDTADITWSLILLWCGITGTVIFTFLIFVFIRYLWKERNSDIAVAGFGFCLLYFLTSFTSTGLIEPTTFVSIVLYISFATVEKIARRDAYAIEVNKVLERLPNRRTLVSFQ
jgi:hypothetical protein